MEPNTIIDLPHVDEDGYFDGFCSCMIDSKGQVLLGADTYNIVAPDDDGKHFFQLSADKTGWVAEAIPATAEECIGIVLDHHKQTARIHLLREIFNKFTEGSTEYRLVQDPVTNARSVEKIPEKTPEEKLAEKEEEVRSTRDRLISETDYLLTADYPIDAESLEAVKSYRQALRDVPQQEGFPWEVVWPEVPAVLKS